ncbi:MAG: NAD(P)H-dependent oxidoreductase [Clostridia bacterium]|nr:NAD(P)H-dependent oxidoreductase [Clostridia bacterium]
MNIFVINASPKKESSITFHHVLFLQKHFKNLHFEYYHLRKEALNENEIEELINQMAVNDLVLFAYPVYTMSVPYGLMQLMGQLLSHTSRYKLIHVNVSQISTSKFLFDNLAHEYMAACFRDMDMTLLNTHSAEREDLLSNQGKKHLIAYMDEVVYQIKTQYKKTHDPYIREVNQNPFAYEILPEKHKEPEDILVIYNAEDYSESLKNMIAAFENICRYRVHLLDLSNHSFKSGCSGCMVCQLTHKCTLNDGFEAMYQEKIANSKVVLIASDIRYHHLDKVFKLLDERLFLKSHYIETKRKAMGYLLTGSLDQNQHLLMALKAHTSFRNIYNLGYVLHNEHTLNAIENLCDQVTYFIKKTPEAPQDFYGVAGMKLYEDIVYRNRGFLRTEHRFLKKNKFYDFPKKSFFKQQAMKIMMKSILHKPEAEQGRMLNEFLLQPYKKEIDY